MQTLDIHPFGPAWQANIVKHVYVEPRKFAQTPLHIGDASVVDGDSQVGLCHITSIYPVFMDEEDGIQNEVSSGHRFCGMRDVWVREVQSARRMIRVDFQPVVIVKKQVDTHRMAATVAG